MNRSSAKDVPPWVRVWDFLGSLKLATWIFILLGVLTFAGTWEQQTMSIYDVQVKYFESFGFVVWWIGDTLPIPLPGGALLLALLCVNLIVGGLIRIRKNQSTIFILITHLGILSLLFGTFIEHQLSTKGQMKILMNETENEYYDIHQWEVLVTAPDGDGEKEYLLPWESFKGLDAGEHVRWTHPDLPFVVELSDFARNGRPQPARPGDDHAIDGFVLARLKPAGLNEGVSVPALIATLRPKQGSGAQRSILWGQQPFPWDVTVDDTRYFVDLRPRT